MASGLVGRLAALVLMTTGLAAGILAGCQKQEFTEVDPRAIVIGNKTVVVRGKQLPPNIMLLVDRSGSMIESVTGVGPACSEDGLATSNYDPNSPNRCKLNDLKDALSDPDSGVLARSGSLARFGLLAFPADRSTCDPGSILVPVGEDLEGIRTNLRTLFPGGGTPSAGALLEAATDPALAVEELDRRRFAMLLTDGLPNCNAANAARCVQCRDDPSSCGAEQGCRPTDGTGFCSDDPFDGAMCLDDAGMVRAVEQLREAGIDTFVIGFGSATSTSDANRVLNAAALAGGVPRTGAAESYYQADSVEELRAFFEEILAAFPCTYELAPRPADPGLVGVSLLDSQGPPAELRLDRDWRLVEDGASVQLLGDWCTLIQNAPSDRYQLRIVFANPF